MTRVIVLLLGLIVIALPGPALADLEQDLEAMRAEAMAVKGAVVSELPDMTIVWDGAAQTFAYFTRPGHYAHPAAVWRQVVAQKDGVWTMVYAGWPYEEIETAPETFRRWMDEFFALDEAMRQDLENTIR